MGNFYDELYSDIKNYVVKRPKYTGVPVMTEEEIASFIKVPIAFNSNEEKDLVQDKVTSLIQRNNPYYNPNEENMLKNVANIPKMRNAYVKGMKDLLCPTSLKHLQMYDKVKTDRRDVLILAYANKYLSAQTKTYTDKMMSLVDKYNELESSGADKSELKKIADEYSKNFAYVSKTTKEYAYVHMKDKDPDTGKTLADEIIGAKTSEQCANIIEKKYVDIALFNEFEYFLKDDKAIFDKYGEAYNREQKRELDKLLGNYTPFLYLSSLYANPLCGCIDFEQYQLCTPLSMDDVAGEPALSQYPVLDLTCLDYAAAADMTLVSALGSKDMTIVLEDGTICSNVDMKEQNIHDKIFIGGQIGFAVNKNNPLAKPVPFLINKDNVMLCGDQVREYLSKIPKPEMDPSVKKPGLFTRVFGGSSPEYVAWKAANDKYQDELSAYKAAQKMLTKIDDKNLKKVQNVADKYEAKKQGVSIKQYKQNQNESFKQYKAKIEESNSKLFDEIENELNLEKKTKLSENFTKRFSEDNLLKAFAENNPGKNIPEALKENISKIASDALFSGNAIVDKYVNSVTAVKGDAIIDDYRNIVKYHALLQDLNKGPLENQKEALYSDPKYPEVADKVLKQNTNLGFIELCTLKPSNYEQIMSENGYINHFVQTYIEQTEAKLEGMKNLNVGKNELQNQVEHTVQNKSENEFEMKFDI